MGTQHIVKLTFGIDPETRELDRLAPFLVTKRRGDTVATAVAVVVFWPAAFLVGGNDQQTAELAQMRGQMQAIEQVANRKNCNIQFNQRTAAAH